MKLKVSKEIMEELDANCLEISRHIKELRAARDNMLEYHGVTLQQIASYRTKNNYLLNDKLTSSDMHYINNEEHYNWTRVMRDHELTKILWN